MIYDLKNQLHRDQFSRRSKTLLEKGQDVVELKVKTSRSLRQNSYLHLLFSFFAQECGYTSMKIDGVEVDGPKYVKEQIYKRLVNRDVFVREIDDKFAGKITYIRSSSALSKEEMTLTIERFRNWSSQEAGIYLPSADEQSYLEQLEIELGRQRMW